MDPISSQRNLINYTVIKLFICHQLQNPESSKFSTPCALLEQRGPKLYQIHDIGSVAGSGNQVILRPCNEHLNMVDNSPGQLLSP